MSIIQVTQLFTSDGCTYLDFLAFITDELINFVSKLERVTIQIYYFEEHLIELFFIVVFDEMDMTLVKGDSLEFKVWDGRGIGLLLPFKAQRDNVELLYKQNINCEY